MKIISQKSIPALNSEIQNIYKDNYSKRYNKCLIKRTQRGDTMLKLERLSMQLDFTFFLNYKSNL